MAAEVVTTQPQVAFYVAMFLYALATVFHLGSLARVPAWVKEVARWAVIADFVAHAVDIG